MKSYFIISGLCVILAACQPKTQETSNIPQTSVVQETTPQPVSTPRFSIRKR